MDFLNKRECKLCGIIIRDDNFEEINDDMKDIFAMLLLKLSFNNEAQSVVCKSCFSKLVAASNFKSTCLYTDNIIIPYLDFENPTPVDLKEIYKKEKESEEGNSMLENQEICRLCLQAVGSQYTAIHEVPSKTIEIFIPEINFLSTKYPAICSKCLDALCAHSAFVKRCSNVDENTNMMNRCIKNEELDIKSEETEEDQTNFDIPCNTEETEAGVLSEHSAYGTVGMEEVKSRYDSDDPEKTEIGVRLTRASYKDAEIQVNECNGKCAESEYRCDQCAYKTRLKYVLERHQLIDKNPSEMQIYECVKCDYKSLRKDDLKSHQSVHKDPLEVQLYKCDKCEYTSARKKNLTRHQFRHRDPAQVKMWKCEECKFETKYKGYIDKHRLKHKNPSEVPMYQCDQCDYKSFRKADIRSHQARHGDPSRMITYTCDQCKYTTTQKKYLARHQSSHKDPLQVRMYSCDRCGYKSRQKANIKKHELRHRAKEVLMHKCGDCDYSSNSKRNLEQHGSRHRDPSRITYTCDQCQFETKYKAHLKGHGLRHRNPGEVPTYEYRECDYRAIAKGRLQQHMLKHKDRSEVRMYKCYKCPFETKYKPSLIHHVSIHEAE